MKKVLLAAVNARYSHSNLALLYLRNHVSDLPFEIEIAEYSINLDADKILHDIRERHLRVIAFSVYIWNTLIIKKILASLHEEDPGLTIILGGPEVTFNAPDWLRDFPFIAFIITGGGEAGFRRILTQDLSGDEKIIIEANPPFSEISFPYRHEDFARLTNRYLYYESGRGCPFRCSYCLSSRLDHRLEFRDMEQVREEIDFLTGHKPRLVKFVDRTFNARPGRSRAIWEYLINSHPDAGTCFHFEIFPAFLDEEDFYILAKAPRGLIQFEMGIQSVHEETLRMINRRGRWEETAENIRRVLDPGNIHVHTDIIAGLPGEDAASFGKSFDSIYGLGARHFQAGILKVLPGTEMRERAGEYNMKYDSAPPYAIMENRWIGRHDMDIIKAVGEAVDRIYNSGKFPATLHGLEKLHGSPFHLFSELARFTLKGGSGLHGIYEWKDLADVILSYVSLNFPGRALYTTDCLRWDWFTAAKDRRYPSTIAGEFISAGRKRLASLLQDRSYREKQRERGVQISSPDLKQAKFFMAETVEFRNEYTGGMAFCLEIPGRELIFLDER